MAKVLGWKLFSNKDVDKVSKYVDSKGHWIILDMFIDKATYMLVNIYAPSTDDVTFFPRHPLIW